MSSLLSLSLPLSPCPEFLSSAGIFCVFELPSLIVHSTLVCLISLLIFSFFLNYNCHLFLFFHLNYLAGVEPGLYKGGGEGGGGQPHDYIRTLPFKTM